MIDIIAKQLRHHHKTIIRSKLAVASSAALVEAPPTPSIRRVYDAITSLLLILAIFLHRVSCVCVEECGESVRVAVEVCTY